MNRRSFFAIIGAAIAAPALAKVPLPKQKKFSKEDLFWGKDAQLYINGKLIGTYKDFRMSQNSDHFVVSDLYPEFAQKTQQELVYDHNPFLKLL